jgi:signal transduction histidine kinase
LGYSELFLFQLAQDHPLRGEMLEIRKAAERAASLTRQLLTFSRRQPVELKLLSLNESVLGIEKMLRYLMGENIDLVVRTNAKLDRVRADSGQLEQVLMNLCVNARDAMPRGGRLTIETVDSELDDEFCVRHPGLQPGPYVLLRVSDTGLG